ncbi:MAG TPA: hypothetical protein VD999_07570 [Vitreimonas sp.]|nr:hypothetical protein [Vitreimonas sp.]
MKPRYDLQIKSPKSLHQASDFLNAVGLHCNLLPEYTPMKWGWFEPLKESFDVQNLNILLNETGGTENVWWKCAGVNKADGEWMKRWKSRVEYLKDTHSTIGLAVYDDKYEEKLLEYLRVASKESRADFGYLDSVSAKYAPFAMSADWSTWTRRGDLRTCYLSVTTHTLRHWLPDLPWSVVFGPAYVRMFGKERLLSTPVYRVDSIADELVFLQLTPKMEDIHEKYDEVMEARAVAKKHLGEECFFKPELAYDYKVSIFNKLTAEEIEAKRGKVFRVPEFELEPE